MKYYRGNPKRLKRSINLLASFIALALTLTISYSCSEDESKFSTTDETPYVVSTSPVDGTNDVYVDTYISVTLNQAETSYTPKTNTQDIGCHGNLQLSKDNFVSCIMMAGQPSADVSGRILTARPLANLDLYETYKIRYRNPDGSSSYTSSTGFITGPFPSTSKDITAFSFLAANNPSLSSDVIAIITGTNIVFDIPFGANISSLIATFSTTGDTVTVSSTVQTSGTSVNDFSSFLIYQVTAEDGSTKDYTVIPSSNYSAGSVSFVLTHVPGGITFPTGIVDSGTTTVASPYQIARTEVTYELWYIVYNWSTDAARGANVYNYSNAGREGSDGTDGAIPTSANKEPVTWINWRDAMVWMNALTEYFNSQNGTSLTPVYEYSSSVVRDSRDSNATECDNVTPIATADGFRLLSSDEWELAARYIKDNGDNVLDQVGEYYPGWYASGADEKHDRLEDGNDYDGDGDIEYTKDVAIYVGNSNSSTAAVKSQSSNALGLYDMSGNVFEFVFDLSGSNRVHRGGCWYLSSDYAQVSNASVKSPLGEDASAGFRLARTP